MATRKFTFENNGIYHIYNRGVDKRRIFMDEADYSRIIFLFEVCNSSESAPRNIKRYVKKRKGDYHKIQNVQGRTLHIIDINNENQTTEPLVEIINWCLIPNHYHLCLRQLSDSGISKFLQKVMTGYTMYFNKKYERSGVLFQGKTKSKLVDSDDYFEYLQYYMDFNPLDIFQPNWKNDGIKNKKEAKKFLENYLWNKRRNYSNFDFVFENNQLEKLNILDIQFD